MLKIRKLSIARNYYDPTGGYNVAVYTYDPAIHKRIKARAHEYRGNKPKYPWYREFGYGIPKDKIAAWISLAFKLAPSDIRRAMFRYKYLLV